MTAADGRHVSWAAVMPVYNEQADVTSSVRQLRAQFDDAGLHGAEIVVVDDGSCDDTADRLSELADVPGLRVIRQPNSGRFAARRAGLLATSADLVLLVDCGLGLHDEAITFLARQAEAHPERRVWNGDVEVLTAGSAPASLWKALTAIGWRRYFADRQLTSYGADAFDLYPKGTGLFAAPRTWLLQACADYVSTIGDARSGSDDTAVIRHVLNQAGRIWLSPEFGCTYTARTSWREFAAHARSRGVTFVDGYLRADGPIGRLLRIGLCAAGAAAVAAAAGLLLEPLLTACVLGLLVAAAGSAGAFAARRCGCSARETAGFLRAAPVFLLCFGSGLLRGLRLAARATLTGRRGSR